MGLWREVNIKTSGPVALRYPTVLSQVNSPANDRAQLTVTTQLKNATDQPVKGTLKGTIEKTRFELEVELGPHEGEGRNLRARQVFAAYVGQTAPLVARADGHS